MHPFKKTALAGAVLLALSGMAAHAAEPSNDVKALKGTVEELRKQIQELKRTQRSDVDSLEKARLDELGKQVEQLRAQLKKQQETKASEPGAAASAAEAESQEAVDAKTPATKADIQGLRTDLENYKYDNARQLERNVPSVTRNTKIGGSITLQYATQNPGVPPTTASGTNLNAEARKNGFAAPSVGLNFTGNLYRDYKEGKNLDYRLAFLTATNVGSNAAAYNATGQANPNGSQFNLTDAYIKYSFQPQTGNGEDELGTITLGQQVVPFGQDAQALDAEVRPVINGASYVSGLGFNNRQIGIVVAGDFSPYVDYTNNYRAPLLSYAFGLFNGSGPNKNDNNSDRDFSARLVYTLPVDYASWFRQLQIGASYYRGYPTLGASTTSATNNNLFPATGKGNSNRTGFDVNWTHLPYSISYEWVYGKDALAAATPANPDGFKRGIDQYINFGYTWGEQFLASSKNQGKFDDWWPKSYQAFFRYDTWNPNASEATIRTLNSDRKQYISTLGLNVFFAETTKFQIDFIHTRYDLQGQAPSDLSPRSTNGILAQFNATF